MKISNSKKQLAKIIHENGGWPHNAEWAAQCKSDNTVSFYFGLMPQINKGDTAWYGDYLGGEFDIDVDAVLPNWHQTVLSRDEYFHLYPVTEAAPEPAGEAKPSIEQLAADYHNRKDYADRKQQEADAAKADAETKLAELVAAGKALGLVLSVVWVREPIGKFYSARLGVDAVYDDDTNDAICDECGRRWGEHYEDESYCKPRSERENA